MENVRLESISTSLFGYGSIKNLQVELKKLGIKRILIVTDDFLFTSGVAKKVGDSILIAGIEYAIYYNVKANPTTDIVYECLNAAKQLQVDCLVAVGGGSSIDTAKAVSILYTNAGKIEDFEGENKSSNKGLPLVAVNTTAGTGSEVTTFYIITNTETHKKMCMVDTNCKPIIAVNDTQFMVKLPVGLTSTTGMDALTHAIEALQTRQANPLTDKDASWAITAIIENLPKVIKNGEDVQARDMMSYAQYAAGMAFSNSGLGMVHAMAHALGGMYNLPHGICNALLLPHVMKYNAVNGKDLTAFRKIAKALNIVCENKSDEDVAFLTVDYIKRFSIAVGIKTDLKILNVDIAQFENLAYLASKDICITANPVLPTISDIITVYKNAYYQDN